MTKRKVNNTVWKTDGYNIPSSLSEFISLLQDQLKSVPTGYDVKIDIDSYEEYGSCRTSIEVFYLRDETDEEYQKRIQQENFYKNQKIAEAKKLLGIT